MQEKIFYIINNIYYEIKKNKIALETEFVNIEINSIIFIKIVVALEEAFDFEFDDEKLLIAEFPTVKSIVEYVEAKIDCK